jgi:hypothetical protein
VPFHEDREGLLPKLSATRGKSIEELLVCQPSGRPNAKERYDFGEYSSVADVRHWARSRFSWKQQ